MKNINTWPKILAILTVVIFAFIVLNIGIQNIKEKIYLMGIWAPICLVALRATSVIIPALPSTAYSLIAGAFLGFKQGLLTICIADILSCTTCFFLAKRYGHRLVKRLIGEKFLIKIQKVSSKYLEKNFFLMTGIMMTGLFDFFSYGIGLTKTNYRRFLYSLLLSVFLSNPPIVALGAGLLDGGKRYLILAVVGIFILAILTGLTRNKIGRSML